MAESKANTVRISGRNIVPERINVRLPYEAVTTITGDGTAGVTSDLVFRLGSIFDPDYTYTGHQPMGFDQYAALYNEYIVHGCTWHVQVIHSGSTLVNCLYTYPSRSASGSSNINTALEQPGATGTLIPNAGGPVVSVRGGWSARKWFGQNPLAIDDIRSAVTGNPYTDTYLHVGVASTTTGTAPVLHLKIRLVYNVTFLRPQQLAGS
jgi:hypothetical protein